MATALDFITAALKRLGVNAAESPIEANEAQDGLDMFNDMMSEWEPKYRLGFIPTLDVNAEVALPRSISEAVKSNLAIRMAPEYSRIVSPALAQIATESLNSLRNEFVFIGEVEYPDTLPMGSGNECPGFIDRTFFPPNSKENF